MDRFERLLLAIEEVDPVEVEFLLEEIDYHEINRNDQYLIAALEAMGSFESPESLIKIFELLVKAGVVVNTISGPNGTTPLITSCIRKQLKITELLLEAGADIDARDYNGMKAVHHAALSKVPIMKLLIAHGAKPTDKTVNAYGEYEYMSAIDFAKKNHREEMVKFLIEEAGCIDFPRKY